MRALRRFGHRRHALGISLDVRRTRSRLRGKRTGRAGQPRIFHLIFSFAHEKRDETKHHTTLFRVCDWCLFPNGPIPSRGSTTRGGGGCGDARVPGAWGDTGEVPGSRATRAESRGEIRAPLPPPRLLAAPEACARTAKNEEGGRETSVRWERRRRRRGSSERRETRALCSGHATGSDSGADPIPALGASSRRAHPDAFRAAFFLPTRENHPDHRAHFTAKAVRISPRARRRGTQKLAHERGRDASRRGRGDAHLGGYVGLSAT